MRVRLNEKWRIRPSQDGLDLVAPEHNIALELSNPTLRDEVAAILVGATEVPADNKSLDEILEQLENAGVISQQKESACRNVSLAEIKEIPWRIRKDLVGSLGPVTSVYWLDPSQSKLALSQTHLFTAKYLERTGHKEEVREAWASGSDAYWEQAELKAIMEASERHASGIIPQEQLIRSSACELGGRAINPQRVVAYKKAQYRNGLPFIPFSREKEYWWKSVSMFPGGEEKYLPVECLYYPVGNDLTPNLYTTASSSGIAAGLSFEDALTRALYEAIERDAFMIAWLTHASMPLVNQQTIPNDYQERVHSLESFGYHVYFVDITLEFVNVVLAVGVNEKARPSLVLGAASNPNIENALGKSLSEIEHQLYWRWRDSESIRTIFKPTEVNKISDHVALYASTRHISKAAFLWKGEVLPMRELSFKDADVWIAIEKLRQYGIETAVLDLTPEYLKNAGVWVVRAIPLGLIPISFGYGMEPLGMSRYRQMAKRGNPWSNTIPFPHPFS